jgi:hypothetical protein
LFVNVITALSAGDVAKDVVRVSVASLFVALYDTPEVAMVYVPATPSIVNVSASTGVVNRLLSTRVVPV